MPRYPPPKILSIYGGGWSPGKKKLLEAVVLPQKSRCFECDKVKSTSVAFSEKQQNDLRNGIASGQIPANTPKGWITCRDCVGGVLSEMMCNDCELVKPLDDFARTQRRTPDIARCKTCSGRVVNTCASGERKDDDAENDKDNESVSNAFDFSTEDNDSDNGVGLPSEMDDPDLHSLNLSHAPTEASKASTTASLVGSGVARDNPSAARIRGWQAMSAQSLPGANKGKENLAPKQFTAYDAHGRAHIKPVGTSTVSGHDDDDDDNYDSDGTTTPQARGQVLESKGNFAVPEKLKRQAYVPETYSGRNVKHDSDEDDDDDDGDYFVM